MNTLKNSLIDAKKARELANLILIAYEKNKIFLESLENQAPEPHALFPHKLTCNDSSRFDETIPNHFEGNDYEIISWLWHTDRPLGMMHSLRTLPFGYIAANHIDKEISIVFRGTITSDEWRNNLITKPSSTISNARNLGLVHQGFNKIFTLDYRQRLEEYQSFLTRIEKTIGIYHEPPLSRQAAIKAIIHQKVIDDLWLQKGYKIFITGHSLGGALAMLAGFLLLSHDLDGYRQNLSICTFGAPRVGNEDFGFWFKDVDVVRYVNTEDVVPTVPPPTSKIFGEDMNSTNSEKVKAERQQGFENISKTFASTQGAMENDTHATEAEAIKDAFVHIGLIRAFTKNKGSISYNHNMDSVYREGVDMIVSPM
jgi:hypothetical protein